MARFCDSNQKRGLTLVELIVVLVILAVLAALLVPSLTGYIDKAVEKRIMLQARSLMTAAQATIDEAYAKGQLVYSAADDAYVPSSAAVKQAMIKQILDLSEMSEDDCEWRFSITVASNTDYPTAKLTSLNFVIRNILLPIVSETSIRDTLAVGAVSPDRQRSLLNGPGRIPLSVYLLQSTILQGIHLDLYTVSVAFSSSRRLS